MNNNKPQYRGYKFKKKKSFKVDGVKIQKPKPKVIDKIKFRSSLEAFCYVKLKENGITDFGYETETFVIQEKFVSNTSGFELYNKTLDIAGKKKSRTLFGEVTNNIRAITYTPDFIHINEDKTGWVIETKGFRMETFKIKWKMFKYFLKKNGYNLSLYTPNSQENVMKCIQSVKSKYYI